MTHYMADTIQRRDEALSDWHKDLIAKAERDIADIEADRDRSIAERTARHAAFLDYQAKILEAENKADRLSATKRIERVKAEIGRLEYLSAKVLEGAAIMPPASPMAPMEMSADELMKGLAVAGFIAPEPLPALRMVEPVEASGVEPESTPEQQQAA